MQSEGGQLAQQDGLAEGLCTEKCGALCNINTGWTQHKKGGKDQEENRVGAECEPATSVRTEDFVSPAGEGLKMKLGVLKVTQVRERQKRGPYRAAG